MIRFLNFSCFYKNIIITWLFFYIKFFFSKPTLQYNTATYPVFPNFLQGSLLMWAKLIFEVTPHHCGELGLNPSNHEEEGS